MAKRINGEGTISKEMMVVIWGIPGVAVAIA